MRSVPCSTAQGSLHSVLEEHWGQPPPHGGVHAPQSPSGSTATRRPVQAPRPDEGAALPPPPPQHRSNAGSVSARLLEDRATQAGPRPQGEVWT